MFRSGLHFVLPLFLLDLGSFFSPYLHFVIFQILIAGSFSIRFLECFLSPVLGSILRFSSTDSVSKAVAVSLAWLRVAPRCPCLWFGPLF